MPNRNAPLPIGTTLPERVVEDVFIMLRQLVTKLDEYEQTTHSVFDLGYTLEDALESIGRMYREPRPYTISCCSQIVSKFLKRCAYESEG